MILPRALILFFRNFGRRYFKAKNSYDTERFQEFIFNKTEIFSSDIKKHINKNISISKIAGLGFVCSSSTSSKILDFGGAAGIDFFVARELFGFDQEWFCIETEAMCKIARERNVALRDLRFLTLEEYLRLDNVGYQFNLYSNSALQYTESPIATLGTLLRMNPSKVAIIRTPVILEGKAKVLDQESSSDRNGPQIVNISKSNDSVSNAVRIVNIDAIRSTFVDNGYEVIWEEVKKTTAFKDSKHLLSRNTQVRNLDIFATRS